LFHHTYLIVKKILLNNLPVLSEDTLDIAFKENLTFTLEKQKDDPLVVAHACTVVLFGKQRQITLEFKGY